METVLAIDSDPDVLALLAYNLEQENYRMLAAEHAEAALASAQTQLPDLIILEPHLTDGNGYTVLDQLRRDARTASIPVILLSSRANVEERIHGLSIGADDFMAKPFSPKELILRVRALMRRSARARSFLRNGPFFVDKNALKCYLRGQPLELTLTEFKILSLLLERPDQTTERPELMLHVWAQKPETALSRALDTHIKRLREKLGRYGNLIRTVRNVGYRYAPSEKPVTIPRSQPVTLSRQAARHRNGASFGR